MLKFASLLAGIVVGLLAAGCGSDSGSSGSGQGGSGANTGGSGNTGGGSNGGGSGGGTSCELFTCTSSSTCAFQPCMSTTSDQSYCYSQAADASECPAGSTTKTVTIENIPRLLCVPSGCLEPIEYLP